MISTQKNRVKNVLLRFLIFIIVALITLIVYRNGHIKIISNAIQGKKTEKNIIDGVSINDVNLIYDSENNIYYLPINLDNNKEVELKIKIDTSKFIKSKIGEIDFKKEIKLAEKIDYDKIIEITIESYLYKYNCKIKFTNIPIITMNFNEEKMGAEYIYSDLSITDPDYIENNAKYQFYSDSKARYRGSSTRDFEKKSYRVKLEDNIDFGLLGMNCSKTWILDPLVTDTSNLRTKIASDLWGNMNEDLDKEEYSELNSKYVEVYINGKYRGLYLLKEVIDEDLLKLDKDTGVLIKGINWNLVNFEEINNIKEVTYGPFELKYPKNQNKYTKSWKSILKKLKQYYDEDISYKSINKTFYVDNFTNYKLFLLILSADDNYEFKNIYYSIKNDEKDTKVRITPWDVDITFGMLFDEVNARATKRYDKIEYVHEFFGLKEDEQFKQKLKERWNTLSKSVLAKNTINNKINELYEYLTRTGVLERENQKNRNVNVENEMNELKEWYDKRFDVIDKYINAL